MAQFLTPRQSWNLAVKNAVDTDKALPLPPGQTLSREDFSLWQAHVKSVIHNQEPPTPDEWQRARHSRLGPLFENHWDEVVALRNQRGRA